MTAQHRIAQYDTVLNARKSAISYTPSPSLVSFAVSSTGPSEVATDKITDEYLVALAIRDTPALFMQKPAPVGTTTADPVVQTRCRLALMQYGFLETKEIKKWSETFTHRIGTGSAKRRIYTAN
ncbi:unnamed protein product [Fusarium fujikuroi]|uniref:Uncharacterized protein n=1 Tax=Fusarium fujikuroi TaxID=5127 RepID=A0A2H3SKT5_FUSFU|nr:uncharacterized protein FFC1_14120 [Fusarium fujikuroi]VTT57743.1 unnamed protein product [Fusarium fujikuroi]VTT67178.1 unnamed protein product [Fusarium fujikuroi]VZH97088.1 unnamed protein product [Fusarium fujikuroi]